MHNASIDAIDMAAQALLHALTTHEAELDRVLEPEARALLARARADVIALRHELLGLQMGPLYWPAPAEPPDDAPGTA